MSCATPHTARCMIHDGKLQNGSVVGRQSDFLALIDDTPVRTACFKQRDSQKVPRCNCYNPSYFNSIQGVNLPPYKVISTTPSMPSNTSDPFHRDRTSHRSPFTGKGLVTFLRGSGYAVFVLAPMALAGAITGIFRRESNKKGNKKEKRDLREDGAGAEQETGAQQPTITREKSKVLCLLPLMDCTARDIVAVLASKGTVRGVLRARAC